METTTTGEAARPYGTALLKRREAVGADRGSAEGVVQLADVPFEVLTELRRKSSDRFARPSGTPQSVSKRPSKNAPIELSSKKSVSYFKDVSVDGAQKRQRDPRFVATCGNFRPEKFRKNFAFLYDETLPAEERELKRRLEAAGEGEKEGVRAALRSVQGQIRSERDRRRNENVARGFQAAEMRAVKEGKKPYYLKKSARKKLHVVAQFHALKEEGRLEQFVAKKRRRRQSVGTFGR